MVSTGNSIMHIYEALHLYLSKEYKSCDLSRIQFPCDKKVLIIYVNIENHSILVAKSILQFYHITHRTLMYTIELIEINFFSHMYT